MMVAQLEIRERERSGIRKLKIGYNKVFGYYIDVPRSTGDAVPDNFIRKQTLVSNERYFTEELKELENSLLTARDRIAGLEFELFTEIRQKVASQVLRIQAAAQAVAQLDALCSLAETAVKNGYVMPELDITKAINIPGPPSRSRTDAEGHLVRAQRHFLKRFGRPRRHHNGAEYGGKIDLMRQTASSSFMARWAVSFPQKSAVIGSVDRVYENRGFGDLSAGQRTFMGR
jgi:DNA mismatch repair protein MutS